MICAEVQPLVVVGTPEATTSPTTTGTITIPGGSWHQHPALPWVHLLLDGLGLLGLVLLGWLVRRWVKKRVRFAGLQTVHVPLSSAPAPVSRPLRPAPAPIPRPDPAPLVVQVDGNRGRAKFRF